MVLFSASNPTVNTWWKVKVNKTLQKSRDASIQTNSKNSQEKKRNKVFSSSAYSFIFKVLFVQLSCVSGGPENVICLIDNHTVFQGNGVKVLTWKLLRELMLREPKLFPSLAWKLALQSRYLGKYREIDLMANILGFSLFFPAIMWEKPVAQILNHSSLFTQLFILVALRLISISPWCAHILFISNQSLNWAWVKICTSGNLKMKKKD